MRKRVHKRVGFPRVSFTTVRRNMNNSSPRYKDYYWRVVYICENFVPFKHVDTFQVCTNQTDPEKAWEVSHERVLALERKILHNYPTLMVRGSMVMKSSDPRFPKVRALPACKNE